MRVGIASGPYANKPLNIDSDFPWADMQINHSTTVMRTHRPYLFIEHMVLPTFIQEL